MAAQLFLLVPFRLLATLLGEPQAGEDRSIAALDADEIAKACAVRRAILRVGGQLPWQSSCLVRALAAWMMLRRRHLPSVLQLGVRTGPPAQGLSAHAWLKCGEVEVVGVETAAEFTPLAAFRA